MPTFTIDARLPVEFIEENGVQIANCPLFDVASQGDDRDDALRNLIDALGLFFVTCYEMGTLDEVLKQSGFHPVNRIEEPEEADNIFQVSIPFGVGSPASSKGVYAECQA